jgi:hypothetical protein
MGVRLLAVYSPLLSNAIFKYQTANHSEKAKKHVPNRCSPTPMGLASAYLPFLPRHNVPGVCPTMREEVSF